MKKHAKRFLHVLMLLFLFSAPFISETANAQSNCTQLGMGGGIICAIREEMAGITEEMKDVMDAFVLIMAMLAAYQFAKILAQSEPQQWGEKLIELGVRVAVCLMILTPQKFGLPNIPYKIYEEVESMTLKIANSGQNMVSSTNQSDPDAFSRIYKGLIGVAENFSGKQKITKADGTSSECPNDFAPLFLPAAGSGGIAIPTPGQSSCIWEHLRESAATSNTSKLNDLINLLKSNSGYGGLSSIQAASLIAQADASGQTPGQVSPINSVEKIQIVKFINDYDNMVENFPLLENEAVLAESSGITGIVPLVKNLKYQIAIFWKQNTSWDTVLFAIGMFSIYLAIAIALIFISLAYFLVSFMPALIVPIGILVYQMMWVTGVLDGKISVLLNTYKNTIIPYAVGPGLFLLLSTFVAGLVKIIPKAIENIDPAMPVVFVMIFVAIFIGLLGLGAFKMLSKVFEWSKAFISLNLEPLLNFAMSLANVVKDAIVGVIKLGAMAITGGAVLAGAAAAKAGSDGGAADLVKGATGAVGKGNDKGSPSDKLKTLNQLKDANQPNFEDDDKSRKKTLLLAGPSSDVANQTIIMGQPGGGGSGSVGQTKDALQETLSKIRAQKEEVLGGESKASLETKIAGYNRASDAGYGKRGDVEVAEKLRSQLKEVDELEKRESEVSGQIEEKNKLEKQVVKDGVVEALKEMLPFIIAALPSYTAFGGGGGGSGPSGGGPSSPQSGGGNQDGGEDPNKKKNPPATEVTPGMRLKKAGADAAKNFGLGILSTVDAYTDSMAGGGSGKTSLTSFAKTEAPKLYKDSKADVSYGAKSIKSRYIQAKNLASSKLKTSGSKRDTSVTKNEEMDINKNDFTENQVLGESGSYQPASSGTESVGQSDQANFIDRNLDTKELKEQQRKQIEQLYNDDPEKLERDCKDLSKSCKSLQADIDENRKIISELIASRGDENRINELIGIVRSKQYELNDKMSVVDYVNERRGKRLNQN